MFVILSKVLPLFVYPPGLLLLALLAALVFRRYERFRNTVLLAALAVILISGNGWLAMSLARSLEWQYLPQPDMAKAEAIVILGGGTESAQPPRPTVEVNGAGDRVIYAARLYHQGKAPYILASGGNITWLGSRSSTPAAEMAELLLLLDVPAEAVWQQVRSQNTYEDALYSAEILKAKGIQRVILVTSAMHMPRSVGLFRRQGIEVIPAPTDYSITQAEWDNLMKADVPAQLMNLIPSIGSISMTTGVLKEYIGMWVYSLRGWM